MSEGFQKTAKQREFMDHVFAAVARGGFISLQEMHAALSYGPSVSNQAVQCTARFLESHGVLVRSREKGRVYYKPTLLAYQLFRGG